MAIIRVYLDAVRYISARGNNENDEMCHTIMDICLYGRSGLGVQHMREEPYHRDETTSRVCNISSKMIASKLGDEWYKLVSCEGGIEYIYRVLTNQIDNSQFESFRSSFLSDEELIKFLKHKERVYNSRYVSKV